MTDLDDEMTGEESLAQLLIHFLQYVEAKLGKNSAEPPATRIPVSIGVRGTGCPLLRVYT